MIRIFADSLLTPGITSCSSWGILSSANALQGGLILVINKDYGIEQNK